MATLNILDYRWAAIKMGRSAWRGYGRYTTLTQEDADSEALLALAECPRTFDATKGTFGIYCKRAAWNAVRRLCEKEQRHGGAELPEEIEEAAPPIGDRAAMLRSWVAERPERAQLLGQLVSDPIPLPHKATGRERAAHAAAAGERSLALADLRQRLALARPTGRLLTSAQAAKSLRMADRRLRDLCERAVIPAYRDAGVWAIPIGEVKLFRRARIVASLEQGANYRAAQKAGRCSLRTVHRSAKAARLPRTAGRPAVHDHELIMSMLTDPVAHPLAWRRGLPVLRAVARLAGCQLQVVQRLAE